MTNHDEIVHGDDGGLYIATVLVEYYDGAWMTADHLIDLFRYVRAYRDVESRYTADDPPPLPEPER